MTKRRGTLLNVLLCTIAGSAALAGGVAAAQTQPKPAVPEPAPAAVTAPAAPTTTPATKPAAKKPSADELLPKDAVELDFENEPIKDVLEKMGKTYGFKVNNVFDFTSVVKNSNNEEVDMPQKMYLKSKLTAKQALSVMSNTLLVLGYQVAENVAGDPPGVVVTIYQAEGRDTTRIPVYAGTDPNEIPEGEEIRTQVMLLHLVNPAEAKDDLEAILGKTDITISVEARQLTITDTSSHVRTAARALQLMEKKAGNK